MSDEPEAIKVGRAAISFCRQGKWEKGLEALGYVIEAETDAELPGQFFTYLGYGMVRFQRKRKEGLELCQRGLNKDFLDPENYLYLARTYLLLRNKPKAIETVERGLKVDEHHPELMNLRHEIGVRRLPVLGFLPRSHPVNRVLGKLRHRIIARFTRSG